MSAAFKYKTTQPPLHEAPINAPIRVGVDVRTWNPASRGRHPYTQALNQVGGKGRDPPPQNPTSNRHLFSSDHLADAHCGGLRGEWEAKPHPRMIDGTLEFPNHFPGRSCSCVGEGWVHRSMTWPAALPPRKKKKKTPATLALVPPPISSFSVYFPFKVSERNWVGSPHCFFSFVARVWTGNLFLLKGSDSAGMIHWSVKTGHTTGLATPR